MREIKIYVRFYLHRRNSWPDQSPQRPCNVVLAFNRDGFRLFAPTGLKIAACDWDMKL